jgi:hypothetical protein
MWIIKSITFIEYHPYIFLTIVLIIAGIFWFFWREHRRPSYKQQMELERLLKGLKKEEEEHK